MLKSLIGSAMSMFWSFVMMGVILYLFSLLFVSQLSGFVIDALDSGEVDIDDKYVEDATRFFGSIGKCMLTLYQCASGGEDWGVPFRILLRTQNSILMSSFLLFIMFWTFAVMNILGGIFLEKTLSNSAQDREEAMLQKRKKDEDDTIALRELFASLDADSSGQSDGYLTKDEFLHYLQKEEVATFLSFLGIDVSDAEMFFNLLVNASDNEAIDANDFIDNCSKLKGTASSLDVALVSYELKLMRREIGEIRGQQSTPSLPKQMCTDFPLYDSEERGQYNDDHAESTLFFPIFLLARSQCRSPQRPREENMAGNEVPRENTQNTQDSTQSAALAMVAEMCGDDPSEKHYSPRSLNQ